MAAMDTFRRWYNSWSLSISSKITRRIGTYEAFFDKTPHFSLFNAIKSTDSESRMLPAESGIVWNVSDFPELLAV
jgi:hypothetical protein